MIMGCLLCSCIVHKNIGWPMYMYDPQHTGYSYSRMPKSLYLLWEYKEFDSYLNNVIVSEGRVIAVLEPRHIISLDISDGSLQWHFDGDFSGYPAATKDRIFVGTINGIFCLDAITGSILWEYKDKNLFHNYFDSPPIVVSEYIFIGTGSEGFQIVDSGYPIGDPFERQKRLLCIHTQSGEIMWEFHGKGIISESPAYADGRVFISGGSSIYCLDADTGDIIWEKEVDVGYHLSLSHDGKKIFIESYGEVLECLNSDNGESLWQFDCGSLITVPIAVGHKRVYCGSEDGMFYCIDLNRGDLIWKKELGNFPSGVLRRQVNILVLTDKKLAVGAGKTLYILDTRSGKILESYTAEIYIDSIALSDGKLFIGERTGRILCLGSS